MKKGIEFSERERHFVEKTLQTRTADGVAHRILENVERIENGCREWLTRFGCLGAAFQLAGRAKMTVVETQTPSKYIYYIYIQYI